MCVLHIFSRYIRQGHFHVQNAFVLGWPSLFKYANRKVKIMCICVVQNQIEKNVEKRTLEQRSMAVGMLHPSP